MGQRRLIGFGIVALLMALVGVIQPATPAAAAGPPVITTQPPSDTYAILGGANVSIASAATGSPNPTVQWETSTDGGGTWANLAGKTSATLTGVALTSASQIGTQYRAAYTNSSGTTRTNATTLQQGTAPAFTTGLPAMVKITIGVSNTLTVAASGTPAPTYQWQRRAGTSGAWDTIAGATGASYSFNGTPSAVQFRVVATNSVGSATTVSTSSQARYPLAVRTSPQSKVVNAGTNATFTSTFSYFDNSDNQTFVAPRWERSTDGGTTWASVGTVSDTLTVYVDASMSGYQYRAIGESDFGSATSSVAVLTVANAPKFTSAPSGVVYYGHGGVPVTVTASATGTPAPTFTWYSIRNGTRVERGTGSSVSLGAPFEPAGTYYVDASNSAGTVTRSFTLAEGTDALVTSSPTDITVSDGLFTTFTSAGVGTPAPTMQWQRSNDGGATWSDLAGQTQDHLTIIPRLADSGARFRVRYVNQFATSVSASATLTVNPAPPEPVITDQPDDVTVYPGDPVSFTAAAQDYPGFLIRWQYRTASQSSWSDLGYSGSTLSLIAGQTDGGARVRAVFMSQTGTSYYSDPASLTILTPVPASVSVGPGDATGHTGSPVSFTVTPAGGPTPTVQWQQKSGDEPLLSQWTDIPGATSTTYTFTPTASNYFDQFRAVVTNRFGSATSSPAALILTDAPDITFSPLDKTIASGLTAHFVAYATEERRPTVTYGWERSTDGGDTWSTVEGADSNELDVATTMAMNGDRYRLVATNAYGSSRSEGATLTVTPVAPPPPTISGSLSATPNGAGWYKDPVTVSFTCTSTALASCSPPVTVAGDGAGQSVTGTAMDTFGQVATTEVTDIDVDTTAPTISGAATTAANPDGGYFGSVTVHWTCSDATSGISLCPADQTVSGEGNHVVTGVAIDRAGNTTTTEVTIRIDHDASQDPGIIHGLITDRATGAPVAGATVALYAPSTVAKTYSTVTATDGTYILPAIADGTYALAVSKSGSYLTTFYPSVTDIAQATRFTVAKGSNRTVDQTIAPGYVLSGRLTSSVNGAPISGATVRVQGGGSDYSAVTDSTGQYAVTGMTAGTRTVTILAYGFTSTTVASVAIPAVSTLDRALVPVGTSPGIKGTITAQATGLPLAGATVRVWVKGGSKSATSVVTDENGRYSIPSLPIGDYEIDVIRSGYAVRWFGDAAARTGATTVTLTTSCTSTPNPAWGDPCATPVDIAMRKP